MNLLIDIFAIIIVVFVLALIITYERLDKRRFSVNQYVKNNINLLDGWKAMLRNSLPDDSAVFDLLSRLESSSKAEDVVSNISQITDYIRKKGAYEPDTDCLYSRTYYRTRECLQEFGEGYTLVAGAYNLFLKKHTIPFLAGMMRFHLFPVFPIQY